MLPLFLFLMIVILVAFYLGSRLIRIEYESHHDNWVDDGKPADYFGPSLAVTFLALLSLPLGYSLRRTG